MTTGAGATPVPSFKEHVITEAPLFDSVASFDEKVAPLVKMLAELCRDNGIPFVFAAYICNAQKTHDDGEVGYKYSVRTSAFLPGPKASPILHLMRTLSINESPTLAYICLEQYQKYLKVKQMADILEAEFEGANIPQSMKN